jgi:hypothetical protein
MRLILFFLKFFLLAAFFIVSNQNLALVDDENRDIFFQEYKDWVYSVGGHIGSLTSYVIRVEWLPDTTVLNDEEEVVLKYSQVRR